MKRDFVTGARISLPICMGVIPIGISYGLIAVQGGFTSLQAILMSALVIAGSAQIMAVGMVGQGASVGTIVLATFLLNLRLIVMSSSIMNTLKKVPFVHKLAAAFTITDESFALFSFSQEKNLSFLLGANLTLYVAWVGGSAAGCMINAFLPDIIADSFGIAFYAAFLAMLIPSVNKNVRLLLLVCITALMNTLLQLFLPSSYAIIISMILGAAIGTFFVDLKEEKTDGQ